ncbi:MAG: hypothetical protein ACR5K2_04470 [Wolbachia sp.]
MNKNVFLITGFLSGRLLHDFTNSMNGIIFALEELEQVVRTTPACERKSTIIV